jgi:hypothetical protein
MGTEFGLWYSLDGGESWWKLAMGLPSTAYNDVQVHPRDNDLIVGTHGRGIWILDQINALQELSPELHDAPAHLFTMEPARQIRYRNEMAHMGDMVFNGENPPAGAIIDYWIGQDGEAPRISVHDVAGEEVAWMDGSADPGLNRVVWNLRHSLADQGEEPRSGGGGFGGFGGGPPADGPGGPLVIPGSYTVRLTAGGQTHEQSLRVEEDPRLNVSAAVRTGWTADLLELAEMRLAAQAGSDAAAEVVEALDEGERSMSEDDAARVRDMNREWRELTTRLRRLYGEASGYVGPLSGDQASERMFYREMLATLTREWAVVAGG